MNGRARFSRWLPWTILLGFVAGMMAAAGCTSAGASAEVKQTASARLTGHRSVVVEVATKDLDFDPRQTDQLAKAILDGLGKSGRFDKVCETMPDPAAGDLKLSVVVQLAVGPNMGHVQSIETIVTVASARDGKTLASANVNAHTAWSLFGGNMSQAIAKLSDQIVDYVTGL